MISALKRLVASNENNNTNNGIGTNGTGLANNATGQDLNNGPAIGTTLSHSLSHVNLTTTSSLLNNGMQMISQSLQKKFSKGVNYNSLS
jgi:hypothetical protein